MERKFYDKNQFEILSYGELTTGRTLPKNLETGMYVDIKEEDILTEQNAANYTILKVRRIADGMIFKLGDKVKTPATGSIITRISFNDDEEVLGLNITFEDGTGDFLEDIEGFATDAEIAEKKKNNIDLEGELAGLMKGYGGIDEDGNGQTDDTGLDDQFRNIKNWMDQNKHLKNPPQNPPQQ